MSTRTLVYDYAQMTMIDAVLYDFKDCTLVFSPELSLSTKCYAVYERFKSQYAVYDFLNEFYPDDHKWAYCEACDCESPYEPRVEFSPITGGGITRGTTVSECLVCGSLITVSYDDECGLCGYSIRFDGMSDDGQPMYIGRDGARTCDTRDENAPAHVPAEA